MQQNERLAAQARQQQAAAQQQIAQQNRAQQAALAAQAREAQIEANPPPTQVISGIDPEEEARRRAKGAFGLVSTMGTRPGLGGKGRTKLG